MYGLLISRTLPRAVSRVWVLVLTLVFLSSHGLVDAYDPNIPTQTFPTTSTPIPLPGLSCSFITFNVPANRTFAFSVSVAPAYLALGYTPTTPDICRSPDSAKDAPNYVQILNTVTAPVPANGVYNVTSGEGNPCWNREVTITMSASTGFSGVYDKPNNADERKLTFGPLVLGQVGDRACSPVPTPPPTTTGGGDPAGTRGDGAASTWGLLPPPPGAKVYGSGGSSTGIKWLVSGLTALISSVATVLYL
ncbi:hypothetical protein DFS34DRAFT_653295 [Phlyctochytrium arcticum]|nr:hypothetical protein DFS34DRAFT_653295 [Phlyctochytrium arcticum]